MVAYLKNPLIQSLPSPSSFSWLWIISMTSLSCLRVLRIPIRRWTISACVPDAKMAGLQLAWASRLHLSARAVSRLHMFSLMTRGGCGSSRYFVWISTLLRRLLSNANPKPMITHSWCSIRKQKGFRHVWCGGYDVSILQFYEVHPCQSRCLGWKGRTVGAKVAMQERRHCWYLGWQRERAWPE